jgi:hypothetical protein
MIIERKSARNYSSNETQFPKLTDALKVKALSRKLFRETEKMKK